jgi:ABC-type amino acid transport system permease subunit
MFKIKKYLFLIKPLKMATTLFAICFCILLAILLGIVFLIMPKEKMKIIEKWIKAWKRERPNSP